MADEQTPTPVPTQTHKNPWAIITSILIVLLILAAGYYFWGQKYFSFGQKISSFADCQKAGGVMLLTYPEQCTYQGLTFTNPNQAAGAPPTNLKSYQSNQYGVGLKYSNDFTVASSSEIATDAFTEKGDILLADFALNKDLYKGTNLSSADILLSVAPNENETDCQKYARPDRSTNLNTTKFYNNINFFYGQTGGAAAGTQVTNNVYHTFYNGTCYKINTVEFIADIGNFEPGAVKEFNEADVQAKFDTVLSTFKFTPSTSLGEGNQASATDTSGWKTYNNSKYSLELQYPPGAELKETTSADGHFLVFLTSPEGNFTIIPSNTALFDLSSLPTKPTPYTIGGKKAIRYDWQLGSPTYYIMVLVKEFPSGWNQYNRISIETTSTNLTNIEKILSTFKFTSTPGGSGQAK